MSKRTNDGLRAIERRELAAIRARREAWHRNAIATMPTMAEWNEFLEVGAPGWFGLVVQHIEDAEVSDLADELVAADICIDPAWSDFSALSKTAQLKWLRLAKIEVDHRKVETDVRAIIEATEIEDYGAAQVLADAMPSDVENRRKLSVAEKQLWCARARLARRGEMEENDLDVEAARRVEIACARVPKNAKGVYFLTVDLTEVKIGYAADVAARMATLQTGNPRPLQLMLVIDGTLATEKQLHKRFAAHRISPLLEWFRLEGELAEFVSAERSKRGE